MYMNTYLRTYICLCARKCCFLLLSSWHVSCVTKHVEATRFCIDVHVCVRLAKLFPVADFSFLVYSKMHTTEAMFYIHPLT